MINYYLLIKPGIILGNLITFAAGFLLASKGHFNVWLFVNTLMGLALIIASACIFNNFIDRHIDQKMERTKKRALATGSVKDAHALGLGFLLAAIGNITLLTATNPLTVAVANLGFVNYVFIYSFIKSHTTYSTLIGTLSGAIPPLVGYCAVSNRLDLGAALLFLILVLWQMPHFFAIGLWHLSDYTKADIPILPVKKGIARTKVHMLLYLVALIPTVTLLTYFNYTGTLFLSVTTGIGVIWLWYCLKGFKIDDHVHWGRQMFRLSLLMINAICLLIPF